MMTISSLKKLTKITFFAFLLTLISANVYSQTVNEPKDTPSDWSKPYEPFRIVGNLYYVGTYDLACYLITSPKGNILINTGLANSATIIEANIKKLGFSLANTKILLTTQAHYDHMGAMAILKKKTGAKVLVNQNDAQVMRDGGSSDYALGNGKSSYQPLNPDQVLKDGALISLGGNTLKLLNHPGHTKGSSSYIFDIKDGNKTYKVLIANMPSIVTEKKFADIANYPTIEKDYAYTLAVMKNLKFDIWLSSHASQFDLHEKHKPGDKYSPAVFIDPVGYQKSLADLQLQYTQKINKK